MAHYSSIQLFTDNGLSSDEFYNDVSHIEDAGLSYTHFQVTKQSREGAVWVVYSEQNYGGAGGGVGTSKVALPNEKCKIKAGFSIKSIQAFNVTNPCICLFEHSEYRGYKKAFQASVNNIEEVFPTDRIAGASSAIATSGEWHLHAAVSYTGPKEVVNALQTVQEKSLFSLNDKVKSVELVRA